MFDVTFLIVKPHVDTVIVTLERFIIRDILLFLVLELSECFERSSQCLLNKRSSLLALVDYRSQFLYL